ncbi:MAG: amidohydrolase family protein [Acidimicrobiales bacterium]
MAHELVIRGGTVVDGTGADARTADVAIDGGRIVAVGQVADAGTTEVDADGALVTPGWVDIHSHYDGQATWDDDLAPSSWHGVTTLVMGNCGVGFAPAAPDRHDWLIGLMEGVEDIPGTALAEGITWEWETFPEYLDALDRKRWTTDVGTQIAHGAVRAYVMGERGARNEPATPDDIEAMAAIVREAIEAGALGFSTSRTIAHRAIDGEPVPGTFAAEDELFGIGRVLGELGTGVFELAPAGVAGEDLAAPATEVAWMRKRPRRSAGPSPSPCSRSTARLTCGASCSTSLRSRWPPAPASCPRWPVAPPGCCRASTRPTRSSTRSRCTRRSPGRPRPRRRRGSAPPRGGPPCSGGSPTRRPPRSSSTPPSGRSCRRPARLRARPRGVDRGGGRGQRPVHPRGGARRHARQRRPGPALPADPQLQRRPLGADAR